MGNCLSHDSWPLKINVSIMFLGWETNRQRKDRLGRMEETGGQRDKEREKGVRGEYLVGYSRPVFTVTSRREREGLVAGQRERGGGGGGVGVGGGSTDQPGKWQKGRRGGPSRKQWCRDKCVCSLQPTQCRPYRRWAIPLCCYKPHGARREKDRSGTSIQAKSNSFV